MAIILKEFCWSRNGDATVGSLNCRRNFDEPLEPFFDVAAAPASPVGVFSMSQLGHSITVSIQLQNTDDDALAVFVSATETSAPALLGNLTFPGVVVPAHGTILAQGSINTAYFAPHSTSVRRFTAQLHWTYTSIGAAAQPLADTTHTLYLLPDRPVGAYGRAAALWDTNIAAYNAANISYIWTELLDACCDACEGYAAGPLGHDPATNAEHVDAFTYGLYHACAFHYDVWSGACNYAVKDAIGDEEIKLKKYLRDLKKPYKSYLNCTDCATIVAMEALACGIPTYTARMENQSVLWGGFGCNPIVAIGCGSWAIPFGHGFAYHEVTVLNAACDQNTPIYDACLCLDNSDFPSQPGPDGKVLHLPLGSPFAETNAHVVAVPPHAPYRGNCYRERLAADGEDCFVNAGAYCVTSVSPILSQSLGDGEILATAAARLGVGENPLPPDTNARGWEALPLRRALAAVGEWRPKGDYGRHREYTLVADGAELRVFLWAGQGRDDTWRLLLARAACVASPALKRLENAVFGIEEHYRLFAQSDLVVEVWSPGKDAATPAAAILQALNI